MSPQQFADRYLLALEQAIKEKPSGGLNGFEPNGIAWMNLLVLAVVFLYTIHQCRLGG